MPPKGSIITLLFRILGRRVFLSFGLVTFLIVFLLSAVTVTSRYAMQRYVADQVDRMPWDLSVYQTAEVPLADRLSGFDQGGFGHSGSRAPLLLAYDPALCRVVRWSTTSSCARRGFPCSWPPIRNLLPPDLRPSGKGVTLVLVGSKAQMGDALLRLQNRKRFDLVAKPRDDHHQRKPTHDHKHPLGIITVSAADRACRPRRRHRDQSLVPGEDELADAGTRTRYDPVSAHGIPKLIASFDAVSRGFMHDHDHTDIHGSPGDYFPEIIHLAKLDRANLISGWDIEGSLRRIITAGSRMTDDVQEITASAAVDHNLGVMFVRMSEIAKRIALISLLVSLPLLLMAAILLSNLSALLLLNERRKLGLLRLRGASGDLDWPDAAAGSRSRRAIGRHRGRGARNGLAAADLFRRDSANRSHRPDPGAALPRTVSGWSAFPLRC